jgi:hypothetical protein
VARGHTEDASFVADFDVHVGLTTPPRVEEAEHGLEAEGASWQLHEHGNALAE